MQGVASYQFTLSGSYKIREILYQLHYSKPEAYDNAEFHQAILRGKVPADNLQSKLRNDLPSHYRGKKKNQNNHFTHVNYSICKVRR